MPGGAEEGQKHMRYQGEGIPHFATDPDIRTFFEVALGVEWIDDIDRTKGNATSDTPFARSQTRPGARPDLRPVAVRGA
ncbi:hypothetical protein [Streptomyces sp. MST-110588]|uniref:hypothetical protein n=1 Tax=Streptomyces sp. MST-110588 TaxID=2833628 RepID=UPI001F5C99F7|nr:hypothetical protein [Streptomyces sp. MST-110588]UNO41133.1 hypothetical protein KGS77_18010 [Streptomyces sp. MST-110588]